MKTEAQQKAANAAEPFILLMAATTILPPALTDVLGRDHLHLGDSKVERPALEALQLAAHDALPCALSLPIGMLTNGLSTILALLGESANRVYGYLEVGTRRDLMVEHVFAAEGLQTLDSARAAEIAAAFSSSAQGAADRSSGVKVDVVSDALARADETARASRRPKASLFEEEDDAPTNRPKVAAKPGKSVLVEEDDQDYFVPPN